jgi:hypothetical protein
VSTLETSLSRRRTNHADLTLRMAIGGMNRTPRVFPHDDVEVCGWTVPKGVSFYPGFWQGRTCNGDKTDHPPSSDANFHVHTLDAQRLRRLPRSERLRTNSLDRRRSRSAEDNASLLCSFRQRQQELRWTKVSSFFITAARYLKGEYSQSPQQSRLHAAVPHAGSTLPVWVPDIRSSRYNNEGCCCNPRAFVPFAAAGQQRSSGEGLLALTSFLVTWKTTILNATDVIVRKEFAKSQRILAQRSISPAT